MREVPPIQVSSHCMVTNIDASCAVPASCGLAAAIKVRAAGGAGGVIGGTAGATVVGFIGISAGVSVETATVAAGATELTGAAGTVGVTEANEGMSVLAVISRSTDTVPVIGNVSTD